MVTLLVPCVAVPQTYNSPGGPVRPGGWAPCLLEQFSAEASAVHPRLLRIHVALVMAGPCASELNWHSFDKQPECDLQCRGRCIQCCLG